MAKRKPLAGRTRLLSEAVKLGRELHSMKESMLSKEPGRTPARFMSSKFALRSADQLQADIARMRRELSSMKSALTQKK